ncbi:hypothetical protein [Actinacidiphila paucisporea]|nr:hypothetical protein [Actinacidiphila paucisporea]
MNRLKAALAAASVLAATLLLGTAGTASADVPIEDYGKYVTIDGPQGLEVGGDWGVWTLHAKNPNGVADSKDHLVFNAFSSSDEQQLQFQVRTGTGGAWTDPQVQWSQMSSWANDPQYLASIDVTGAALDLAPHADTVYQLRARRLATGTKTEPFETGFSAFLTPQRSPDGQPGAWIAQAGVNVAPLGLTTTLQDLPTAIPADGRARQFTVHMTTANQADWHLGTASFFLWQGQGVGRDQGPSTCDAELDVLDSATGTWHQVGLGVAGVNAYTVDLGWAKGTAYDRTLTARITLGGGFKATGDASIGFGYYPGSGETDYFWEQQPLSTSNVSGAPACAGAHPGATFHATTPTRVLDTRNAIGVATRTPVAHGGTLRLTLPAGKPIPAGATAVVLNVTATQPTASGVLTVYPDGKPRPTASNLNWAPGQTIPNQVVVPLGAGGKLDLYDNSGGTVHLIADVTGYYTGDTFGATFNPVSPARLLDTRAANGVATTTAVPAHGTVHLQVDGRAGLPENDGYPVSGIGGGAVVDAVVLNVTATAPTASGVLTVYPDGDDRPIASSLNWTAGTTIANHVVVPVGADGKVAFYNNSSGTVHLVADISGYYATHPSGAYFHPIAPTRLMDTRTTGAVPAMGTRELDLAAGTAVPANATGTVLNVTVTQPRTGGFVSVYPHGTTLPTASNINWKAGQTIPNLVTTRLIDRKILFFNHSAGTAHFIADAAGYFTS